MANNAPECAEMAPVSLVLLIHPDLRDRRRAVSGEN